MYAIIQTGGKQYRVAQGEELLVEKLPHQEGESFEISDLLLIGDGDEVTIGTPTVAGKVVLHCVGHEKAKKVHTVKFKRRKNYRRTQGHRQQLTRLRVESISKN